MLVQAALIIREYKSTSVSTGTIADLSSGNCSNASCRHVPIIARPTRFLEMLHVVSIPGLARHRSIGQFCILEFDGRSLRAPLLPGAAFAVRGGGDPNEMVFQLEASGWRSPAHEQRFGLFA